MMVKFIVVVYRFKILCEILKVLFEISKKFEPIHHKICILQGAENFMNHDFSSLSDLGPSISYAPQLFVQLVVKENSHKDIKV